MKNVISFLNDLKVNNNREWFEANKPRYKEINDEFCAFTEQLIAEIAKFDPTVAGLTPKDCMYRIYRDTRFSNNKEPYKTHIGAYICQKGKKSGYAGYYFHVEAEGVNYIGGHILASGIHCPEPAILRSVRDEILDNGKEFLHTISEASGFTMEHNDKLQRVPTGYPKDSEYAEYLKFKDFTLYKSVNNNFMTSKKLLDNTLQEFRKTVDFIKLLNKAVDFAFEEMADR